MNGELLKENLAKNITYSLFAFAPEGSENQRSSYMRKLIYPAKRSLIEYTGVEDAERLKQASLTTPLQVLSVSVEDTVSAFYEEAREAFSLTTGNEQYSTMQERVRKGLDQSEQRLTALIKQQINGDAATKKGVPRILPAIFSLVDGETKRLDKFFRKSIDKC